MSEDIDSLVNRLRDEDSDEYLYRGQSGLFGPRGDYRRQIPSVFRSCQSQLHVDDALTVSHRRVAWLFDRVRRVTRERDFPRGASWELARAALTLGDLNQPASPHTILAIAQHYGVATQGLDLTQLDPAAVFATQEWFTIEEAGRMYPGSSRPARSEYGAVYRYRRTMLRDRGIAVVDLGNGVAGSRPVVQEARVAFLNFDQDVALFEEGCYEVFPFRQTGPYTYSRPIVVSPHLTEDQAKAVLMASTYAPGSKGARSTSFSMRDLVQPSFHFAPHPYNADAWEVSLGARPDPLLALGRLCEGGFPADEVENATQYARTLFGDFYGRSLGTWLPVPIGKSEGDCEE